MTSWTGPLVPEPRPLSRKAECLEAGGRRSPMGRMATRWLPVSIMIPSAAGGEAYCSPATQLSFLAPLRNAN